MTSTAYHRRRAGRSRRRTIVVLVAIVLLLVGMYHLAHWWHGQSIDRSLAQYESLIRKHAGRNGLSPGLVSSVIRAESGGDRRAVSRAEAKGLMQITPIAQKEVMQKTDLGDGDLFGPDYNIAIGTAYLRLMMERFDDNRWLALAAYNAGPGRISKLRRRYPDLSGKELVLRHAPSQTRAYVQQILGD
ncbi:MAG: lytic transglycosylase domain-containing protein [Phycisphaerae bacterium]